MFCTNATLEAVIARLFGTDVVELLSNAAVQAVSASYDPAVNSGPLFERHWPHAAAIHAYRFIERRCSRDAAFRSFIEKLEAQIVGGATPTTTEIAA